MFTKKTANDSASSQVAQAFEAKGKKPPMGKPASPKMPPKKKAKK